MKRCRETGHMDRFSTENPELGNVGKHGMECFLSC